MYLTFLIKVYDLADGQTVLEKQNKDNKLIEMLLQIKFKFKLWEHAN